MPALPFVGIILMLDSLSISNFFYVRSLRKETDEAMEMENSAESAPPMETENFSTNDPPLPLSDHPPPPTAPTLSNKIGNTWTMVTNPEQLNEDEKERARQSRLIFVLGCVKAALLGIIHREPTEEKHFTNFKPIPYRKGIIATALLLTLSVIVLAPEVLKHFFTADDLTQMMTPDFCKTDDFEDKIEILNKTLEEEETNLPLARQQYQYYKQLAESLQNDTSLYGVGSFSCKDRVDNTKDANGVLQNISGKKSVWETDPSSFPMIRYGTFFPGYCAASRELALENAKNTQCVDRKCACASLFGLFCLKKICINYPYSCPSHTADQESEVENYRQAQFERAQATKDVTFEEYSDVNEDLKSAAGDVVEKLMYQVDIASSLYVGYTALSLFFPTPMKVFRPHYGPMVKGFVFGANKLLFVMLVVAIWWGIEYFKNFLSQLRIYLNIDMLTNPCFADSDFLEQRTSLISAKCDELLLMSNEIRLANVTIDHILQEVGMFDSACDCSFPFKNTLNLAYPTHVSDEQREALVLNRLAWESSGEYLYAPDLSTPFLGNDTICTDPAYTRETYLSPPDATTNLWDVWIKTGLFAMILVEITMANFGVALLRLADPFSACNGKYECPPLRYGLTAGEDTQDLEDMAESKKMIFATLGLRSAVFWGILTNLSLINICMSYWNTREVDENGNPNEIDGEDWAMFSSFMTVGIIAPILVIVRRPLFLICMAAKEFYCTREKKSSHEMMTEWNESQQGPTSREMMTAEEMFPERSSEVLPERSSEVVGSATQPTSRNRMSHWL